MKKRILYILVALLCVVTLLGSTYLPLVPSNGRLASAIGSGSEASSSSEPAASSSVVSSEPVLSSAPSSGSDSASVSAASSEPASSEPISSQSEEDLIAVANAQENIHVPEGQTLVLGAEGAYIFRNDGGAYEDIPASEWETPAGLYDYTSSIVLDGTIAYVRSVVYATVASITGTSAKLEIVDGSDIVVAATQDVAIDVQDLHVGKMNTTVETHLRATADQIALRFVGKLYFGPNSKVEMSAAQNAVIYTGDQVGYYDDNVILHHGTELNVTATGADGIAMIVDSMQLYGARITASAPNGVGGIKMLNRLVMKQDNGLRGYITATSNVGRAFSCESADLSGSEISGITPNGEIGVHANSQFSLYSEVPGENLSKIYGEAYSGYGVVAQSIDQGDQEYPSGSIYIGHGIVEGYVQEGMGVSTNTASISDESGYQSKLLGTAEKGLGISICMLSTGYTSLAHGISRGASNKHFQVYGAIPDSAGINALSYLHLSGAATVIGEAPQDLPGSFGIHCFLPYEGGYSSGDAYLNSYDGEEITIKAMGETGFWAVRMNVSALGSIDARGTKDGLVLTSFQSHVSDPDSRFTVNAQGGTGYGMRVYNEWEQMYSELWMENVELTAKGGEYGLYVASDVAFSIINSSIVATADGELAVAGGFIQSSQLIEATVRPLTVINSYMEASSPNYGWLFLDSPVHVTAEAYQFAQPGALKGTGGECGIKIAFTDAYSALYESGSEKALVTSLMELQDGSLYTIWGISTSTAPDERGRSAAVSVPSSEIAGKGVVLEEYTVIAKGQLTPVNPYAVYAANMNVSDYMAFTWISDYQGLQQHPDGLTAEGNGKFGVGIEAARTSDQGSKTISLVEGTHRIKLSTDINIGEVVFTTHGGSPIPAALRVPVGEPVPQPEEIAKEGFSFLGWYDNGTAQQWDFALNTMYGERLILEAKWEANLYAVAFNANDNADPTTGNMPGANPLQLVMGDLIPKPTGVPTRETAEFLHWATTPDGAIVWNFDNDRMPASDVTLFAIWRTIVPNKYVVVYEASGGTPAQQTESVPVGESIPGTITTPTREGFRFVGWFSDWNTTVAWEANSSMPANDVILYAKWERVKSAVVFNINGGEATSKPEDLRFGTGETVNLTAFQPGGELVPYYTGHFFLGWLDDAGNVVQDEFIMPGADIHLTAQWQAVFVPDLPNHVVAYRNQQTRTEMEQQLSYVYEYVDLLGRTHQLTAKFQWDDIILTRGGIENIQISYYATESEEKLVTKHSVKAYILNHASIVSQQVQTFAYGRDISLNGAEWGPICYAELPDFENQSIKQVPVPVTFLLQGTNIRVAGTYHPDFTAMYSDYFGNVSQLKKTVTAIVLPKSSPSGPVNPEVEFLQYWQVVSKEMSQSSAGTHTYVSSKNYTAGGQEIALQLEYFDKRILAKPDQFTLMTADALQAVKAEKKAQLQVDLGWVQWYFNSNDFKGDFANPAGVYPLNVTQGSDNKDVEKIAAGRNAMPLQFAMNKAWGGTPTMQVQVTDALQQSAQAGRTLYLFWFNPAAKRLELIGEMKNNGDGLFSIRMSAVRENYIIMDELPTMENNKPDFSISNATNPLSDEVKQQIAQLHEETEISDITVGTPLNYEEEEFPMLNALATPLVGSITLCCIIIIILLLIIIGLIVTNSITFKKNRELRNAQGKIAQEKQEDTMDAAELEIPEEDVQNE